MSRVLTGAVTRGIESSYDTFGAAVSGLCIYVKSPPRIEGPVSRVHPMQDVPRGDSIKSHNRSRFPLTADRRIEPLTVYWRGSSPQASGVAATDNGADNSMPFDATSIKKAAQSLAKPVLVALRYALTLVLFCGIWWYDARLLNWAFDLNLALIKGATSIVDGSGKAEAMMRAFAAEKMLLFGEGSALIWSVGRLSAAVVRRFFRVPGSATAQTEESLPQPIAEFRRRFGSR